MDLKHKLTSDDLKQILSLNIYEILERAGISTSRQIITLSIWDIQKLTNLRTDDIKLLKNRVALQLAPQSVTCDLLCVPDRITTGCVEIDKLLKGGYRVGTITELYGESGSGKTQLSLQSAALNWSSGAIYICTEDLFPIKRFEQVKQSIPGYDQTKDYGKNIYVEHITEACDLLSCIKVRLPKLLERNKLSLLVLDSIAGPFRSEYSNYVQRAEELRELATALIAVAQQFKLAILCTNQVTASFDSNDNIIPALGLAWSNLISSRLYLQKTTENIKFLSKGNIPSRNLPIRKLSVIFAPDLENSAVRIVITETGIKGI